MPTSVSIPTCCQDRYFLGFGRRILCYDLFDNAFVDLLSSVNNGNILRVQKQTVFLTLDFVRLCVTCSTNHCQPLTLPRKQPVSRGTSDQLFAAVHPHIFCAQPCAIIPSPIMPLAKGHQLPAFDFLSESFVQAVFCYPFRNVPLSSSPPNLGPNGFLTTCLTLGRSSTSSRIGAQVLTRSRNSQTCCLSVSGDLILDQGLFIWLFRRVR